MSKILYYKLSVLSEKINFWTNLFFLNSLFKWLKGSLNAIASPSHLSFTEMLQASLWCIFPLQAKKPDFEHSFCGFLSGEAMHKFPGRRNNKRKRSNIKVSLNISGKGGSKCDGGNVNDEKSSKRWVQSNRQWPNKLGVEPGNNNNNDFETYSKGFWVKYWYLL